MGYELTQAKRHSVLDLSQFQQWKALTPAGHRLTSWRGPTAAEHLDQVEPLQKVMLTDASMADFSVRGGVVGLRTLHMDYGRQKRLT